MAANPRVRLLLTSASLAWEVPRGASQSVPGLYTLLRPENERLCGLDGFWPRILVEQKYQAPTEIN